MNTSISKNWDPEKSKNVSESVKFEGKLRFGEYGKVASVK